MKYFDRLPQYFRKEFPSMERELAVEKEMQLVVFRLASEEFAFEITQVR